MSPHHLKDTAKEAAKETVDAVKDAGAQAYDAARDKVGAVASDAVTLARDEARTRAEAGKNQVADEGSRLAGGLRDVARNPETSTLQAQLLESVAGAVSDISEGLRDRSVGALVSDVEHFARRNPGAFIAGSALLGFALTRFAKSSAPEVDAETLPAVTPTRYHNNGAMA